MGFLPKLAKSRDYSSPMNKQLCPRAGDIHASELWILLSENLALQTQNQEDKISLVKLNMKASYR